MPANHIRGKLWINHVTKGGFSESYNFATTDYSVARTFMKDVLDYRSLLLPKNTVIEYHSMSLVDAARDSDVVPSHLSAPAELDTEAGLGVEDVDMLDDGLKVRYYTADGKSHTFCFRALRDTWVDDQLLTITPTSGLTLGTLSPAAAGLTAAAVIGSFCTVVRDRTVQVTKTGPGVYVLTAWSAYSVSGISSRDVGPGYRWSRGRRRSTV